MKILIFTENGYCGGLDSFLVTLVNHWPNDDDDLTILCNASHPGLPVIRASVSRPCTVDTHKVPTYLDLRRRTEGNSFLELVRKIFSPLLRYSYFWFYLRRLGSLFHQIDADRLMVVNGGHPASDICRAAVVAWGTENHKPAAIYNFHNLATPVRWFEKWPEKVVDRLVFRHSRAIIGVSRICAESLRERMGDDGMAKVSFIYNGISLPVSFSQTPDLRSELAIQADSPLCVMLGTYEPRKGHDFLLQAFQKVVAEVPNARLLICGYGYAKEIDAVRRLVEKYALTGNVTLQGFRNDVGSILKQSDLLLVASQAYESFGLTSVEAMASKVPVIATRIGGIPEVVNDGEGGFCMEANDVAGYANLVVKFLTDPALRKVQGDRGYQRYCRMFSGQRMAADYADVVRSS